MAEPGVLSNFIRAVLGGGQSPGGGVFGGTHATTPAFNPANPYPMDALPSTPGTTPIGGLGTFAGQVGQSDMEKALMGRMFLDPASVGGEFGGSEIQPIGASNGLIVYARPNTRKGILGALVADQANRANRRRAEGQPGGIVDILRAVLASNQSPQAGPATELPASLASGMWQA